MSDLVRKLTSRKFLLALVGVVSGLALAFGVEGSKIEDMVQLIGGILAAAGSGIAYINGEAMVDAARASVTPVIVEAEQETVVEGFK